MSNLKFTHVFALPGANSILDGAVEGLSCIFGHTLAQMQERYTGAVLMDWDDWQREAVARQQTTITWSVTTKERYRDMLEVLPPAFYRHGLFLVGEPMDHDIATGQPRFSGFWQKGTACFAASRPLTIAEARAELARLETSDV